MHVIIGIILLVLIIALIVAIFSWIFSNFLGVFGIVAAIVGLYYVGKYAKEGKKSKVPGILIVVGVLLSFGWFALSGDDSDLAETEETTEQVSGAISEVKNKDPLTDEAKEEQVAKEEAEKKDKEEAEKKAAEEEKAREEAEAKAEAEEKAKAKEQSAVANLPTATVTRVIDGDTLEINLNGKSEDVRLLLVDTPETKHPQKPVEPFGPEASQFVKDTIEGKEVRIKVGTEERDNYGRLLAYVFIGEETIQELLLRNGLAATAYLYNDLTMLDEFHKEQEIARSKNIGVWSIPGYAHVDHDHGFHYEEKKEVVATTPKAAPAPAPTQTAPPASTGGSEYFKNCTELRKKYPNGVDSNHPAYAPKHDRDKDNWACEAS